MARATKEARRPLRAMYQRLFRFVFPGDDVAMSSGRERVAPYEPFDWLPLDQQRRMRRQLFVKDATYPTRGGRDLADKKRHIGTCGPGCALLVLAIGLVMVVCRH